MLMNNDILAANFGDLVEVIAMLIVALAMGIGHMMRKKAAEDKGKKIIISPTEREDEPEEEPPTAPARPILTQTPRRAVPAARKPQPVRRPTPPARSAAGPARPRVAGPAPLQRVAFPSQPTKRRQRITSAQHAAQLAAHAVEIASHLEQEQKDKCKQLQEAKPGETALPPKPIRRKFLPNLTPRTMRQAVIFSEIFKPPVGSRDDHLSWG